MAALSRSCARESGQSLLPGKGRPLEGSSLTRLRWTSSNRRSASVLYGLAVEPDAEAADATSRSEPDPLAAAAAAVSSSRSFCDVLDLLFFFFFLLRVSPRSQLPRNGRGVP